MVKSSVTGKTYDPTECVRIINLAQVNAYMKNDCMPLDIYISRGKCVFIFDRTETKELYDKWCNYELKA